MELQWHIQYPVCIQYNVVTLLSVCCINCDQCSCASVGLVCLRETELLPRTVFIICTTVSGTIDHLSLYYQPYYHCCKIMFSHYTLFCIFIMLYIILPVMSKMIINKSQKPLQLPVSDLFPKWPNTSFSCTSLKPDFKTYYNLGQE